MDNNSSDNTVAVVSSISDARIFLHKNTHTVSGVENFSRCMRIAGGEYTCIFHADDTYSSSIVEQQVKSLEDNLGIDAVFTQAVTIDESSNAIGHIDFCPPITAGYARSYGAIELLKNLLRNGNRIVISSMMVRSKVFQESILEWDDGSYKSASDVAMYLRLAEYKKILILGDRLVNYRISSYQYSQMNRDRVERPDIFLVLDSYVDKYKDQLDLGDLSNYDQLIWRDRVARSINLLIAKKYSKAVQLLSESLSSRSFLFAIRSKPDFLSLIAFMVIKLFSILGLFDYLRTLILLVKRK